MSKAPQLSGWTDTTPWTCSCAGDRNALQSCAPWWCSTGSEEARSKAAVAKGALPESSERSCVVGSATSQGNTGSYLKEKKIYSSSPQTSQKKQTLILHEAWVRESRRMKLQKLFGESHVHSRICLGGGAIVAFTNRQQTTIRCIGTCSPVRDESDFG